MAKAVSTTLPLFSEHGKVNRFKDEDNSVVTSVYVSKAALKKLGNPPTIKVTFEAGEDE